VTTSTIRREFLFADFGFGRQVVQALRREERHAKTLAFVVMPDHLHWLLSLVGSRTLSTSVNTVKSYAARRVNRLLGRTGPVWQTGFHDHAVRKEESLEDIARYIVLNPVRAGLVSTVGQYPLWDAIWVGERPAGVAPWGALPQQQPIAGRRAAGMLIRGSKAQRSEP